MPSEEKLIEDLCSFADELGRVPTASDMDREGPHSRMIYHGKWGSWTDVLNHANLGQPEPIEKSKLVEHLIELSNELGQTPGYHDMRKRGDYYPSVYEDRFGSWNKALEKAGLQINREVSGTWHKDGWNSSVKNSKDKLISRLSNFADELGHIPTAEEMDEHGPHHSQTYMNRFNSWDDALQAAGMEVDRPGMSRLVGKGSYSYGGGWVEVRRKTIDRDDEMCRVCSDEGNINVHHIKPRRKFDDVSDSNTLDNLITLCPSCHKTFEGMWQNSDPGEFEEKAKELYSQRA